MTALHTAAFYFGWAVLVVVVFFVVHFVRCAADAFTPILAWFGRLMDKYSGTLVITGIAITVFGTLVCAASTRWLAITDLHVFIAGIAILAVGIATTIRAWD